MKTTLIKSGLSAVALVVALTAGTSSAEAASSGSTAVKTTQARKITLRRSTTQPASVHAYYEAELHAKVSGYLKSVAADIGDVVKAGQTLAVIDMPEMMKGFESQQAEVERTESARKQFRAAIDVAKAKVEQAGAEIGKARAQADAATLEYKRIEELVRSKAVTQRLADETLSRKLASEAELASVKASQAVAVANLRASEAEAAGALLIGILLRRFLPSVVVLIVIPLALAIGMLGFYFSGHTINVMTLGGIALAVGTVVDAGIVVVENIVRHLNQGKNGVDAARDGAVEVATPVFAGMVTTLAIFIPAIFLTGMVKSLFVPLSIAAVLTIGASYFVAMTIVPAFCSRMLKPRAGGGSQAEASNAEPTGKFTSPLKIAMGMRPVVIGGVLALVAILALLFPRIGSELFPDVDTGVFEVRVKTTPGLRIEETEKLVMRLEETINGIIPAEEIETVMVNIGLPTGKGAGFSTMLSPNSGPDTAFFVVTLHQKGRKTSTREYVEKLRATFAEKFPQEQFLFVAGGMINAALNKGVAAPINVQVSAGTTVATRKAAEQIVEKLRHVEGAVDVQIGEALDYPQFDVKVDRVRAGLFGLTQRIIAENVSTALASSIGHAEAIWVDQKTGVDFYMGVQYKDNEVRSLDELRNLPLPIETEDGPSTIPLSEVADIERVTIPGEIAHYNLSRVNNVYVNVSGRDLGSVAHDVEEILAGMEFDSGVATTLRGPVATMKTDAKSLGWGLLTAAILVYLVMMAQFRSALDPLIIMLAVPLGLTGVLAILWLTGTTINIQSLMGALMMIGVVVNNSILLVDFANQQMLKGVDAARAAWLAACVRLRPILLDSSVEYNQAQFRLYTAIGQPAEP